MSNLCPANLRVFVRFSVWFCSICKLRVSRDKWKAKYQQLAGQLNVEKTNLGAGTVSQTDEPPPRAAMTPDTAKSPHSLKLIKKQVI